MAGACRGNAHSQAIRSGCPLQSCKGQPRGQGCRLQWRSLVGAVLVQGGVAHPDGRGGRGDGKRLRAAAAIEEGATTTVIDEEEGSDGRGGKGDGLAAKEEAGASSSNEGYGRLMGCEAARSRGEVVGVAARCDSTIGPNASDRVAGGKRLEQQDHAATKVVEVGFRVGGYCNKGGRRGSVRQQRRKQGQATIGEAVATKLLFVAVGWGCDGGAEEVEGNGHSGGL
ncbi:hypothetical protein B296_00048366 [Ensete ventricosum]|uniref:Uncharacterized protein n=1 Tax=Ensete ventricosum TaxID=4639 RepID=A0A426X0J6_ENSVE|nr:hypothetical protein B296_00048366 [Ensete ventricosum]